MLTWYEDSWCYYFWKPHGIASSRGHWPCFLDMLSECAQNDKILQIIYTHLSSVFGKDNEYGLLNRLDNDTAGLLYFAKTPAIKLLRKGLQQEWRIVKYYLADIAWHVDRERKCIAYPIAHHPQAADRMICIADSTLFPSPIDKQYCETWVEKLYYDPIQNYSCVLVMITKWVRHQIRCHLAAIGCPVIGEKLYKKKKDVWPLRLWSVGVRIV